jgi:hypothetical protein
MKLATAVFFVTLLSLAGQNDARLLNKPSSLRGESTEAHDDPFVRGFLAFISEGLEDKKPIPDPTCKTGVASPDLKVCCTDECGSCGHHHLCDDPGKFNEVTGKLVDNCCKERILKKDVSCDKDHPPCVLSPEYKKTLNTYKFERPKRHAMDDCNKAVEIARNHHAIGIDRGQMLAKLYLAKTKYEEALDIAVKVDRLTKERIEEIEEALAPQREKVANCSPEDKKVDKNSGVSQCQKWENELESWENEQNFYKEIEKNAEEVAGMAKTGLKNVEQLRKKTMVAKDLEEVATENQLLVEDSEKVYQLALELWKQWEDSTKDYDCGPPPSVEHAAQQCVDGNTKYKFKCHITCQTGYDGEGTVNELRCLKQGKFGKAVYGEWQGFASCVGRNCGYPPNITKTRTVIQEIRYPNSAEYNCHEGFSVDGEATSPKQFDMDCGDTGNFVQNMSHKCEPVKCGPAPKLKYTEDVPGEFVYTDKVTYHCLPGHTIDETPGGLVSWQIQCQASGRFSESHHCLPVRCGLPPVYTNTHIVDAAPEQVDKFFGDEVHYECEPGYSLDQTYPGTVDFVMKCEAAGEFEPQGVASNVQPKCQPVSAGMSPMFPHSSFQPRVMFYTQKALVVADTGYSIDESPTSGLSFDLTASTEAKYEGVKEFLPVSCGPPPQPANSRTTFQEPKAVFGNILSYTCVDGYSLDKSNMDSAKSFHISCEADGDFSAVPHLGECANIDDCAMHTCGPFGECEDLLLDYKCNCESGYEETEDPETKEKVCGNINDCGPEACGNGQCEDLLEDYRCHCEDGYEEADTPDGEHICKAKECGIPPEIANSATSPLEDAHSKAFFKEVILYQCDVGHTLDGKHGGKNHQDVSCQADTSFSVHEECKPIECAEAAVVEFATSEKPSTVYGESIKYTCSEGHTVDGTSKGDPHFSVSCIVTGKYTDPLPCLNVTCGRPVDIPNAFRDDGEMVFPHSRKYTCNKGFTLDGQAGSKADFESKCQADGKLTNTNKQCLPVVCGEPEKHIDAFNADTSNEGLVYYPQVTTVTCRDGYTVDGTAEGSQTFSVKCQANGTFESYDKQECEATVCGAPPEFHHAKLDMDGLSKCECFKCGEDAPHAFGSGVCAPRSQTCSDVTFGAGCYTKAKVGCDCASLKVLTPVGANLNYEEKAHYNCDPGFTAGGEFEAPTEFMVECLKTGEFDAPTEDMQCRNVDACERHTCGAKGVCIDVVGESKDSYECNCSHGYEVNTDASGEKQCGNIDDCKNVDCGAGVCEDMEGDYTCVCTTGHVLTVLDDGVKTCKPVQCMAEAPEVVNGKMVTEHTGPVIFPESLRFECNEGYSTDAQIGDASKRWHANCKADGTFYGMMSCQKISCGTPRILPNTNVESPSETSSVDFEEKVKYKCFEGNTIGGNPPDGAPSDPCECIERTCGEMTYPAKLEKNGQSVKWCFTAGNCLQATRKSTVDCPGNYWATAEQGAFAPSAEVLTLLRKKRAARKAVDDDGVNDEFETHCQADGHLSDPEVCEPVKCGTAPIMPDATPSISGMVVYGAHLEYECNEGFYIEGDALGGTKFHIACQKDGTFESTDVLCKAVTSCVEPIDHADLTEFNGQSTVPEPVPAVPPPAPGPPPTPPPPPPPNPALTAYWDAGACGPFGDDYNWGWCGATSFNGCQTEVVTSLCPSGKARLQSAQGDGTCCSSIHINGCNYAYFAQYECVQMPVVNYVFRYESCPRTSAGLAPAGNTFRGVQTFDECAATCTTLGDCTLFEINGCTGQRQCSGNCWTYSPSFDTLADVSPGCTWGGSQLTYMRQDYPNGQVAAYGQGCPAPTYPWETSDCCCGNSCCWGRCTWELPPTTGCLVGQAAGAVWTWSPADGFYKAIMQGTGSPPTTLLQNGNHTSTGQKVHKTIRNAVAMHSKKTHKHSKHNKSHVGHKEDETCDGIEATYGQTVEFHCAAGYSLTGGQNGAVKFTSRVNRFGDWDPPLADACLEIGFRVAGVTKDARDGSALDGVTVTIGDKSASSVGGIFAIDAVAPGTYDVKYVLDGFISVTRGVQVTTDIAQGGEMDLSMSPVLAGDQWRAVVKWGADPTDLDSYASWSSHKVCWYGKDAEGQGITSKLEHDDTTGYGPETVYISGVGSCTGSAEHCDIKYQINDYRATGTMREKGAHVTLYHGDGVAGEWEIGAGDHKCNEVVEEEGNWWHVFTISGKDNALVWNCDMPPEPANKNGLTESIYYFNQGDDVPILNSRKADVRRVVNFIDYNSVSGKWDGFTQDNHFAVRWEGTVKITSGGTYTFYIESDDGSKMWITDKLLIDNDGLHGMVTKQGEEVLAAGEYAIRIDHFEKTGGAGMKFKYSGPDTGGSTVVVPNHVLRTNPVLHGLEEEVFYYDDQLSNLPDLNGKTPNMAQTVETINYAETQSRFQKFLHEDHFAVRWTGYIKVSVAGEYTFYVTSDDGSKLWIDGEQIVDNGGTHAPQTKEGKKNLETAFHWIRMEFFENAVGASAILEYQGPDSGNVKKVLDQSVLFKLAGQPEVEDPLAGAKQEIFYFNKEYTTMPILFGRTPSATRIVPTIDHSSTDNNWDGMNQKDKYASQWTGSFVIKTGGSYTVEIESDDASFVYGGMETEPRIGNPGLHGMLKKSVAWTMSPGFNPFRVTYHENTGGAGCILRYSGPDTGGDMIVVPKSAMVSYIPLALAPTYGGFLMQVYNWADNPNWDGNSMPNVDDLEPRIVKANVNQINFGESGSGWAGVTTQSTWFTVRWSGSIVCTDAGNYQFHITSDDASEMFYNGDLLINNMGLHGMTERSASKHLVEGQHRIFIRHLQYEGGAGMKAQFTPPDENSKSFIGEGKLPVMMNAGLPDPLPPNAGIKMEAIYWQTDRLKDFFGLKPRFTRVDKEINYPSTSDVWPGFPDGRRDHYVVRWTGAVVIKQGGDYTFSIESDDGSALFMGPSIRINNDGLHGMVKKEFSTGMNAGSTSIRIDYFQGEGGAGCIFRYKGADTSNEEAIVPQRALTSLPLGDNFRQEEFDFGQGDNVPNLDGRSPDKVKLVSTINYGATENKWGGFRRKNDFAVRWTGILHVETDSGTYSFYTESDDGSLLWVDSTLVVDNNGLHGMQERSGALQLTKNQYYTIRIEYHEKGSGAGCKVKYSGPGFGKILIGTGTNKVKQYAGGAVNGFNVGGGGLQLLETSKDMQKEEDEAAPVSRKSLRLRAVPSVFK